MVDVALEPIPGESVPGPRSSAAPPRWRSRPCFLRTAAALTAGSNPAAGLRAESRAGIVGIEVFGHG